MSVAYDSAKRPTDPITALCEDWAPWHWIYSEIRDNAEAAPALRFACFLYDAMLGIRPSDLPCRMGGLTAVIEEPIK